jgi:two-component system, chemotaxis family, chemotaxis protein CheY
MEGGASSRPKGLRRRGGKVLVVDDDPVLLSVLARAFTNAGYVTQTAENGRRALEVIKTYHPALVVTDIVMPEMEGIGAIMAIKQMAHPPKVIAMSGAGPGGRRNYLKWAEHLGADGVLTKPFHLAEMLDLAAGLIADSNNHLMSTGS